MLPERATAWRDIDGYLHDDESTCLRANKDRLKMRAMKELEELLKKTLYREARSWRGGAPLDAADAIVREARGLDGGIRFLVNNLEIWPEIKKIMDGFELKHTSIPDAEPNPISPDTTAETEPT